MPLFLKYLWTLVGLASCHPNKPLPPQNPDDGDTNEGDKRMDFLKQLQDLLEKLNGSIALIGELQQKLADAEASAKQLADEKYAEGYAKGFEDGKASVPPAGDKLYSQEELDAAIATAVGPLNEQIAALSARVAELENGQAAAVEAAKKQAVEEFKAQVKTAWDEIDEKETKAEKEFAKIFQPAVVEVPPVDETPVEEQPTEEVPTEGENGETPVEN